MVGSVWGLAGRRPSGWACRLRQAALAGGLRSGQAPLPLEVPGQVNHALWAGASQTCPPLDAQRGERGAALPYVAL